MLELEEALENKGEIKPEDKKRFERLLLFFSAVEGIKTSKCKRLVNRAKELYEKAYGRFSPLELPEVKTLLSELKGRLLKTGLNTEERNGHQEKG